MTHLDNALKQCLALVAAILALNTGCVYRQGEATRSNSFAPHAGRYIDHVATETFLLSRVALLVSSDQDPTNKWFAGDRHIPDNSNLGCAAAIDNRGYFLTAAHCLTRKFVYLLFYDSQAIWALRVRVVWQGNPRDGQPDLAIIHVLRTLDHVFDWADKVRKDEIVMAVGLSWTNKPIRNLRGFELMGGKMFDYSKWEGKEGDFYVTTNVPLQSGDSGGPLVDCDGHLIGINVEGTPPFVHWILPERLFPTLAERPNHRWLQEIIEEDVARRALEAAGQFSR